MRVAEQIYETVKTLPDQTAYEILDFVKALQSKKEIEHQKRKDDALKVLSKYKGRFKKIEFSRDELYDR
jgi:hypothetical protein